MAGELELWEEVINHPDYEICSAYPYPIRNKRAGRILKESIAGVGYYQVYLDGNKYYKHRLVATQWIPNDDPALKDQVDHINRDKSDNHISNLRWVSASENLLNRSTKNTTFIDELPEFAIAVEHYGKHNDIQDLYFCDDVFYVYTGVNYKSLTKHQNYSGYYFVKVKLPDQPLLKICYSKFKHEYNLD